MSKYIGKRVSYPCGYCLRQFTLNRKSVETSNNVYCSLSCFLMQLVSECLYQEWVEPAHPYNFEAAKINLTLLDKKLKVINKMLLAKDLKLYD